MRWREAGREIDTRARVLRSPWTEVAIENFVDEIRETKSQTRRERRERASSSLGTNDRKVRLSLAWDDNN